MNEPIVTKEGLEVAYVKGDYAVIVNYGLLTGFVWQVYKAGEGDAWHRLDPDGKVSFYTSLSGAIDAIDALTEALPNAEGLGGDTEPMPSESINNTKEEA